MDVVDSTNLSQVVVCADSRVSTSWPSIRAPAPIKSSDEAPVCVKYHVLDGMTILGVAIARKDTKARGGRHIPALASTRSFLYRTFGSVELLGLLSGTFQSIRELDDSKCGKIHVGASNRLRITAWLICPRLCRITGTCRRETSEGSHFPSPSLTRKEHGHLVAVIFSKTRSMPISQDNTPYPWHKLTQRTNVLSLARYLNRYYQREITQKHPPFRNTLNAKMDFTGACCARIIRLKDTCGWGGVGWVSIRNGERGISSWLGNGRRHAVGRRLVVSASKGKTVSKPSNLDAIDTSGATEEQAGFEDSAHIEDLESSPVPTMEESRTPALYYPTISWDEPLQQGVRVSFDDLDDVSHKSESPVPQTPLSGIDKESFKHDDKPSQTSGQYSIHTPDAFH
ncbi:hypothetical protein AG1IA_08978 [Rhizoctonia solani AG-1 IA]|uniref:Uncharacterized protein n=1 Tax=Thanatephorus cucumeris (strain AG1-IA) TaxID=983506 RepID=L8WJT0_THACA|nr:hypothetical protein AG1IA_08978 [Rhizoctonia solani AG-1 IA]